MKKGQLRGFVFYTQDYFGDTLVRAMPADIRVVWIESFFLMDQSPRRGVLLKKNGEPYSVGELAGIMNCSIETVERGIQYIVSQDIASIDGRTKALSCRRMIREEKRKKINTKNAQKGGNPILISKSKHSANHTSDIRSDIRTDIPKPEPEPDPEPYSPLKDSPSQKHSPPLNREAADNHQMGSEFVQKTLAMYVGLPNTPNRAIDTDRKIAAEFERLGVPIEAVECGLLDVALREMAKSKHINSLVYFVGGIEDAAKQPVPADYLRMRRLQITQLAQRPTAVKA